MVSVIASYIVLCTSVHSSSGTLSIRPAPLYNHMAFSYFLEVKPENCNKEFMI